MRLKHVIPIYILFFIMCLLPPAFGTAVEESAQFAGQWPYHPTKAMVFDQARNLIFFGIADQLTILDTGLNPLKTLTVTESGQISGLFYSASDRLLYIACKKKGLWIIDVSDPQNPYKCGAFFPENEDTELYGLFVSNGRAYLAGGVTGVIVIDVSDPADISQIDSFPLPGALGITYAMDVYVAGNYIWVADLYNGVHVVNYENPENPKYIKGLTLAGARDIMVDGNDMYVSLEGGGVGIIDISSPEDSKPVSQYTDGNGVEKTVQADGNFLYVASGPAGIRVLDVSDKSHPSYVAGWEFNAADADSILLLPDKHFLFMTSEKSGLLKIDVTDKSAMREVASYDTPGDAYAIDVDGGYLYAVDDNAGQDPALEGLRIHQITIYNQVVQFPLTGFCKTPRRAGDVYVSADYAYVADGESGLTIIDVSDKSNPAVIGSADTSGTATGIFVDGTDAYVADGDGGLAIIDVSDTSNPKPVGSLQLGGSASDVLVNGDFAYVADGSQGLLIIDITDKTAPEIAGRVDTPGTAGGIFADGNDIYVADGPQGISIVDVSDAAHPVITGTFKTEGNAVNVSVAGNFAYVVLSGRGVTVLNISDPAQPVEEKNWSFETPGTASDIISGYSGDSDDLYTFVADGPSGVVAMNMIPEGGNHKTITGGGGGGCFVQSVMK